MLEGETARVTGPTSGIGLGIAKSLARRKATPVSNGFGDVDAAKAEVATLGARVGYHGADLSEPAEVESRGVRGMSTEAGWRNSCGEAR